MKKYKKWVLSKLSLVCVLLLAATLVPMGILNEHYLDTGLQGKEYLLRRNEPRVIFAGDSRAERQLVPSVAARILGLDPNEVVNVAVSSGDPLMIEHLAEAYPEKFRQATVIVSISANQINDGARDRGYFAPNIIARMNVFEQLATFFPDQFRTIKSYYSDLLQQTFTKRHKTTCDFEATNGFCSIDGVVADDVSTAKKAEDAARNHPWYTAYNSHGRKRTMTEDSLRAIKSHVGRLIVYTGPFLPSYLKEIEGTALYRYEIDFEQQIETICRNLGIEFRNYLHVPGLLNEHFYDSAHLNVSGAELFTGIVIRDLYSQGDSHLQLKSTS